MYTLEDYLDVAKKAVARSNMLWIHVNRLIQQTIEKAIAEGRGQEWVRDELLATVGKRPKADEPSCFMNIRNAARCIGAGKELFLL